MEGASVVVVKEEGASVVVVNEEGARGAKGVRRVRVVVMSTAAEVAVPGLG